MKILIIDDEPSIKKYIVPFFERKGHDVDIAQLGKEGLRYFKENSPYDVIVVDLGLPDMKGQDIIKEIRLVNKIVPVAVFSGHTEQKFKDETKALGADEYFTKPIMPPELIKGVEELGEKGRG